ncbi:MAG: hypothetical protein H0U88_01430 [Chthoniobacterales bacterium]|nr:hypothetical protein [Chthoniobacterales bacterium]MDQ3120183.1 hypothetical protein [Verrucomicrobiota bacterium]
MKPTPQFFDRNNRRDAVELVRTSAAPKMDYNFQPGRLGDSPSSRGGGKRLPSFRGISDEYFRTEARNYFRVEAALFAFILVTAAVPVIEAISGLAQFVYGIL